MLEKELETFKKTRADLMLDYPNGGFVVINGDEILGVWNDRIDALGIGIKEYGNVSFLVRDIRLNPDDPSNVINLSRDIEFA